MNRIKDICEMRGIAPRSLREEFPGIEHWVGGRREPSTRHALALAQRLGVTVEVLMGHSTPDFTRVEVTLLLSGVVNERDVIPIIVKNLNVVHVKDISVRVK